MSSQARFAYGSPPATAEDDAVHLLLPRFCFKVLAAAWATGAVVAMNRRVARIAAIAAGFVPVVDIIFLLDEWRSHMGVMQESELIRM
jgi:hypothetical protein